jgi:hypothetical protein
MGCVEDHERYPGKFEVSGAVGERLHEMVNDSFHQDEYSLGDGGGWFGLIINTGLECAPHAVLSEDSDGFFTYTTFDTSEEARTEWDKMVEREEVWETDAERYPIYPK